MKKRIMILLAAAAAGMLLLTACTSSDQGVTSSDQKKTDAAASGTQNTGVQEVKGTQMVEGTQTQTVQNAASGTSGAQNGQATGAADGTADPEEDGEPAGEVIPDEDAQAAENDPVDPAEGESETETSEWDGTYAAEEESVTINTIDENTIAFTFATAGISGTAEVDGYQAVYKGDDHYVIVFNLEDGMVDVSVSNEEDYDASESPLIGNYVKEH